MSAVNTFTFSGYTLRPALDGDLPLARAWTNADEDHRMTTPAEFWVEQGGGRDAYLLSDASGPVFFFKVVRIGDAEVELHIQFMPASDESGRERTREGLVQGLNWLETVLRLNGITRARFNSQNPVLMVFCRKRLGFTVEGNTLRKDF